MAGVQKIHSGVVRKKTGGEPREHMWMARACMCTRVMRCTLACDKDLTART